MRDAGRPAGRRGEPPGRHFRSDRLFTANGAWYITTREGIDVGPYRTRVAAETAAQKLVAALRDVTDPELTVRLIEGMMPLTPEKVWDQRWMR